MLSTITTTYLEETVTVPINRWQWGNGDTYSAPNYNLLKYGIMSITGLEQDSTRRFSAYNVVITQSKPLTWSDTQVIVPLYIANQISSGTTKSTYVESGIWVKVEFNQGSHKINYALYNSDSPITFKIYAQFVYFT